MHFSIPLYDALLSATIAPDKAKAVVDAFETEMTSMTNQLATKTDLSNLQLHVAKDMKHLESQMVIKLGAMILASVTIAVTVIKAF
jgi:hypothetical protein